MIKIDTTYLEMNTLNEGKVSVDCRYVMDLTVQKIVDQVNPDNNQQFGLAFNEDFCVYLYTWDDIKRWAKESGQEPLIAAKKDFFKVGDGIDKSTDLYALMANVEIIGEE